jgi:hypothetical protein
VTSHTGQPRSASDKHERVVVSAFCGEEPYALAKNEAFRLIAGIESTLRGDVTDIWLDFTNVQSISPSGALALFVGLFRRFGVDVLDRIIFQNADEHLLRVLDEAATDAAGQTAP